MGTYYFIEHEEEGVSISRLFGLSVCNSVTSAVDGFFFSRLVIKLDVEKCIALGYRM